MQNEHRLPLLLLLLLCLLLLCCCDTCKAKCYKPLHHCKRLLLAQPFSPSAGTQSS
jgi:hypothetical protein